MIKWVTSGPVWAGLLALLLVSRIAEAFDSKGRTNVVNYWGQNSVHYSGGREANLAEYCRNSTVDVLAIAFIYSIDKGQPLLNLAYHCEARFPGTNLLHCPKVAQDIKYCQSQGKIVQISIGGASGSYAIPDAASGLAFADKIWDMFLGGSAQNRPFNDAILDGVDLDLEAGQNDGYVAFIQNLRGKFASVGGGRKYYISGAPQCPYPDHAMKAALASSWFDMVWIQFYNNYCGVQSFGTSNFNFDTWNNWASTVSLNKDVRILLGVPGGPRAAGSGVIDANRLNTILAAIQSYSHFGGVMMWDAGVAHASGLAVSASAFLKGRRAIVSPDSSTSTESSVSTKKSKNNAPTTASPASTTRGKGPAAAPTVPAASPRRRRRSVRGV